MRLRRKLTIAFFAVSSLLSVLFALFLYRFVEGQLTRDLRDRLRDLAHVGAHMIDLTAYQRLVAQLGDPTAPQVAAIEDSADYRRLSDQLNAIRSAEPTLIQYAYLLAPGQERSAEAAGAPRTARFVVDADVLKLRATEAANASAGRPGRPPEISHFNQPYDVTAFPLLQEALRTCAPQLEPDFIEDPEFGVSSVSAYVPLASPDGTILRDADGRCGGVLGVDITDRQMQAALDATSGLTIKLSMVIVALALLVSIAMGTVLTRSILALTQTVKRFADKDFSARTPRLPRDEIGQLGENFNAMAATIQQHSENLEELVSQRTKELVEEKQTSERLLLNVLPAPIADRLKSGENLIVDRFEAVSVLFADIVGFTAVASRTSPEVLVTMLNELFSMYDRLAERHGLEKIKTIGDAYMAVAGIPEPNEDHALVIARMAVDMIAGVDDYAKRHQMDLSIRVGIHTGSVVAGVIGTKKFIYDLWGDTVNTASRMESTGIPGRVQASEATYQLLVEHFEWEARGLIDVKGKGEMPVYLLVRPREAGERRAVADGGDR
ncbi:MAG: adenylate/guanylate cyclase domain-containing protein [Kofleriaceae bacterium]